MQTSPQTHHVTLMANGWGRALPDSSGYGQPIALMGARMSFPRNAEIYGEAEPAEFVYQVVSGSVRTSKILADGRRQVGGFYLPGDIFGLDTGNEYAFSAEAISDVTVLYVRRSAVLALAERDGHVACQLWAATGRELTQTQGRVLLLYKSAPERMAGFLLEMADRARCGDAIDLPMSRQDIADYLGLTIETVSRTLSTFVEGAMIELATARRILICDRAALEFLDG
jgi:CRP-like cAMP-binding protein